MRSTLKEPVWEEGGVIRASSSQDSLDVQLFSPDPFFFNWSVAFFGGSRAPKLGLLQIFQGGFTT